MKPFVMYGRVTSGCDVWRSGEEPRSSVDVCFPERLSFGLPAVSISLSLSLGVCDKTLIGAHGSRASSVDGERRGPNGELS